MIVLYKRTIVHIKDRKCEIHCIGVMVTVVVFFFMLNALLETRGISAERTVRQWIFLNIFFD